MAESGANETYEDRLFDVAETLQIPDNTLQITRVRLDRLSGEADIDETHLDSIGPAVLALSCREDGLPLPDDTIVDAWDERRNSEEVRQSAAENNLPEQIAGVAERLNIDHPPARPDTLVDRYIEELDAPEQLATVARRVLTDTYSKNPRVVAEASSPSETAGAAIVLAAELNDLDGYGANDVSDIGGVGGVMIKNRYSKFLDTLDDETLESAERYRLPDSVRDSDDATAESPTEAQAPPESSPSAEADGNGKTAREGEALTPEACMDVVNERFPDELPTTTTVAEELDASADVVGDRLQTLANEGELDAKRAGETVAWIPGEREELGAELTIDAVQKEVDAIADATGIDAALRLFARGLVSDAAEDVPVDDASEFAGAALIASSRLNDGDLTPDRVASEREFQPRTLYTWLDQLGDIADVDIPRREPADVVESLVSDLGLSETVREESLRSIEHYRPADDGSLSAPELAAGAVFFASTTIREPIDLEELADSIGFAPANVSDAMNSVFVSLCRRLVRGEIAYEECSWTADLLESDHIAEIGDPHTGRVVAAAKTYIAGREGEHVDEGTLDVLLGNE